MKKYNSEGLMTDEFRFRLEGILERLVGERGTLNEIVDYIGQEIDEKLEYEIETKERGDNSDFSIVIGAVDGKSVWYATIFYLKTRERNVIYVTEVALEQ